MPISYYSRGPPWLRKTYHPKILFTPKTKTLPQSPPTLTAHSTDFPNSTMDRMTLGELHQWRAKFLEKFQRELKFPGDITQRMVVLALKLDAVVLEINKQEEAMDETLST